LKEKGRSFALALALCLTSLAVASPQVLAEVRAPSWTSLGPSSGLWQTHSDLSNGLIPMWFDLDGDENPEPLWWSALGSVYLERHDTDPHIVPLELPDKLKQIDNIALTAVALDSDGDGDQELLVIGRELVLLNHAGGAKFTVAKSNLPTLPGALVNDVAVGDLNQDGLPDLVLALALGTFDRTDMRGVSDLVLMNLGLGRFERHRLEPSRDSYTCGITLADIDRDGRLDIVESVDASAVTGPGRVLLNRTEPGARTPDFEISEHVWDSSPFGMGAAVADVDGDGYMDIYNTSVGRDLLVYGSPDGSFTNQTHNVGITHEWGEESLRTQWSPSFLDLNGDGQLDIFVRHGGKDLLESGGLSAVDNLASDLVYVQDSQGHFHRVEVPDGLLDLARGKGRHASAGDWNGDGLPDMALGGLDGASDFWSNETSIPPSTRAVTIRFQTTVSAWPPTGSVVTGRCGEATWTRHLTSGGLLGASAATEVYGAWDDCSATPEVEVRWPSGARSTHTVQSGETVIMVTEPRWWSIEEAVVTVNPGLAGSVKACIGGSATDWNCCEVANGPCEFTLANLEEATSASLDDSSAVLITPKVDWGMHISPSPPRPGTSTYLNILHVGAPSTFSPETTTIWINGVSQLPDPAFINYERRTVQYKYEVPEDMPVLYVTLFPLNLLPEVTWTLPTGNSIDSDWLRLDSYPNIIFDGETQGWHVVVFANLLRDLPITEQISYLTLETETGAPVPMIKQYLKNSVSRVRMLIDPLQILGVEELRFQDAGAGHSSTIVVPQPLALEDAVSRLKRVDGNVYGTSTYGAGDLRPLFLTLRDENDLVLPPERELISLEVDGAHVSEPFSIYGWTYNLSALVHSDGETGPGEARVRALDGSLLGAFPFERRSPPEVDLDLSATTAELMAAPTESAVHATHRVVITPRLMNGELAGAAAQVELLVSGAETVVPLTLSRSGVLTADLLADPIATELEVEVRLDGAHFADLFTPLEPAVVPEPDGQGSLSDVAPAPAASPRDDGCGVGGPGSALVWFALVGLSLVFRRRQAS
jgi:hypothetical protein